jgi:hypothetical protein
MDVATYAFFYVECHIHVLIDGCCQAEGVCESTAGPP